MENQEIINKEEKEQIKLNLLKYRDGMGFDLLDSVYNQIITLPKKDHEIYMFIVDSYYQSVRHIHGMPDPIIETFNNLYKWVKDTD